MRPNRALTWSALTAVVALGAGETSWTKDSTGTFNTSRSAIAWSTSASIFACNSVRTFFTWRTALTNEADVSFVTFVAFGAWDALCAVGTLGADGACAAKETSRTRLATRTHRSNSAFRSASSVVAFRPTSALLAFLAVCSRQSLVAHRTNCTSRTSRTCSTSGALRAVTTVLARRSSVTSGADRSSFARRPGVTLRARMTVPAWVASCSRNTASAIFTVQAWQTSWALQHKCYIVGVSNSHHTRKLTAKPSWPLEPAWPRVPGKP